ADLLDRSASPLDEAAIGAALRGKRVLISGAGGSIGSQIAKIVARFAPASLLLMERSENALFEIDRVIAQGHPALRRRALLHDVTDAARTFNLLQELRPDVVFHAAAHKHVPMLEDHPAAALVNNFFGTRSLADAALACAAERFVMISTDKAVNPASVMGATKRTAELYVQSLADEGPTRFSIVRFGNVLGSACSVVPIWSQQLAGGGPLTVTDRRMTRYFMTIPEAASLVIQAATLGGEGAPVFVLDMGEPIRIVAMAERFIRLHHLEPNRDVHIEFTGMRPGEKLHEQLAYDSEDVLSTTHPGVRRLRTEQPSAEHVRSMVREFEKLRHSADRGRILMMLRQAVPQMAGV
ncbi:MAG: polysaccharide biosynthesis protein, partial [Phycisphaeraceae bacterium]